MWQDLRQAARSLGKHPGFVSLAAIVLALGIALNTAIFSIVYSMLYKPLPVESPGELASIYAVSKSQPDRPGVIFSPAQQFFKQHSNVFTDVTMHWGVAYMLRADGESEIVNAEWVLSNYFDVLGVEPMLGRPLQAAEDQLSSTERAVVISHALWVRRFKSDPAIVGRQITLALTWAQVDLPAHVVGVMGPDFKGISEPWKPTHVWIAFAQGSHQQLQPIFSGAGIGRLRPGISLTQARAAVETQSGDASGGLFAPGREPRFVLYRTNDVRMPFNPAAALIPRRLAAAMTVVVMMVLLVAATNIAGILMARGVGRSGEIAVRRVLGAAPLRIVRQLLAESLLLSFAGGLLGFVAAGWLLGAFRVLTPIQFAFDVARDARVAVFTSAVCILAGIVVGVLPARQAIRLDVLPWLAGSGGTQTRQTKARLRHAITLPQVAVSLMLLLVAGVYVRALLRVELADLGYEPRNVLVVTPTLRWQPDDLPHRRKPDPQREERVAARARAFYQKLLERLHAMPGAADSAIASSLPLREPPARHDWRAVVQEDPAAGGRDGTGTERASVSPGFFRTLGIKLVDGRDFDERDTRTTARVAIVSASVAHRLWPGRAVGRTVTMINEWPASNERPESYQVVGVVDDVQPVLGEGSQRPFVYFALGQQWRPTAAFVLVRGAGDSRILIPVTKDVITRADAFADVYRVQTMTQMVGEILYPRRIAATVLAVSGLVALLLSTIGVYGVVSYSVAQRTGEIGVRMALGAERGDIIRLVLAEGARVAALGSVAGLVLGYAAIAVTSSRYLAVPRLDILSVVLMSSLICGAVVLACYVAARRAGRLDPMDVLRRT